MNLQQTLFTEGTNVFFNSFQGWAVGTISFVHPGTIEVIGQDDRLRVFWRKSRKMLGTEDVLFRFVAETRTEDVFPRETPVVEDQEVLLTGTNVDGLIVYECAKVFISNHSLIGVDLAGEKLYFSPATFESLALVQPAWQILGVVGWEV